MEGYELVQADVVPEQVQETNLSVDDSYSDDAAEWGLNSL
jgi:hypothetical protein